MNSIRSFSLTLFLSVVGFTACFWVARSPINSKVSLFRQLRSHQTKLKADGMQSDIKTAIILVDHGSKRREANQHVEQVRFYSHCTVQAQLNRVFALNFIIDCE